MRLLAKSCRSGDDPKFLPEHTDEVLAAVEALFGHPGAPTRLGLAWMRFFSLSEADFDRFLRHLRVAAAAHDWGKANDGFEDAVTTGRQSQVIRHEHLSGMLLADPVILGWMRRSGLDEMAILAAVISHHAKAGEERSRFPFGALLPGSTRETVRIRSDHGDFAAIWRKIQDESGLPCPDAIEFPTCLRKEEIQSRFQAVRDLLKGEKKRLRDDPARKLWVAALRAGLIVADAVGSAVVRMPQTDCQNPISTIDRWVHDRFSTSLTPNDVWSQVIKRRVEDLRERKRWNDGEGHSFGDERGFNEFQVRVADQGPRVLLTAPCGSGKTLAAWNWIKAQLDARPADRPISRVLFLYPTRATATEGFRDYVSWAPEEDAGLLSGTADYDLQDMFSNPDDARHGQRYGTDPRLYTLAYWKKRIVSATADQFFPFLQYGYGPLCLLPMLAESVVVVDEVHIFDKKMFSTLKQFLRTFPDIPTLCMTATLPAERACDLTERCGLTSYPKIPPPDLVKISSYPRYQVEWINRDEAKNLVAGSLATHRVLWVVNRVADCQDDFADLRERVGEVPVHCYHSRFKLEHRKNRHNNLVHGFQDAARDDIKTRGILGVTTQVCEMSLDLDAEILVTDLATIAALIQRMGRCNRDSGKMKTRPIGRVYVLRRQHGKEKPYTKEELDAAERFVNRLSGRDVSQDQLEHEYRECDPGEVEPDKTCPFLISGPYADGSDESFREGDDFTVPTILDDDLRTVLEELHASPKRPIDGYIVPVPHWCAVDNLRPDDPRFPRWLSVARASQYDPMTGFHDRPHPSAEEGGDNP